MEIEKRKKRWRNWKKWKKKGGIKKAEEKRE